MTLEQGLLKAMVLTSLKKDNKNASDIFDFITTNSYSYTGKDVEYLDVVYTDSIEALRVELVYLRNHGYIKKTNRKRPFTYAITSSGKQNLENPFRFMEVFNERVGKEVKKATVAIKKEYNDKLDAEIEKIKAGLESANELFIREKMQSNVIDLMKNEDKFKGAVQAEAEKLARTLKPVQNTQQIQRGSLLKLGQNNVVKLDCGSNFSKGYTLKVINGMPIIE